MRWKSVLTFSAVLVLGFSLGACSSNNDSSGGSGGLRVGGGGGNGGGGNGDYQKAGLNAENGPGPDEVADAATITQANTAITGAWSGQCERQQDGRSTVDILQFKGANTMLSNTNVYQDGNCQGQPTAGATVTLGYKIQGVNLNLRTATVTANRTDKVGKGELKAAAFKVAVSGDNKELEMMFTELIVIGQDGNPITATPDQVAQVPRIQMRRLN